MTASELVVLVDVDNTLLDNDLVRERLDARLQSDLGLPGASAFWEIYERVRGEQGYVDFPATIQRFCAEFPDHPPAQHLHDLIFGFPFHEVVYHDAAAVVAYLGRIGLPVILSDGDAAFQPHKIRAAGLEQMFDGRVLIFVHKETERVRIEAAYPAQHYVMVDDKPRIHPAMKAAFGSRITTVMVCQGSYAHDPAAHDYPGADIVIEEIGEVVELSREVLLDAAAKPGGRH